MKRFVLRIPDELHRQIVVLADQQRRSMNTMIQLILENAVVPDQGLVEVLGETGRQKKRQQAAPRYTEAFLAFWREYPARQPSKGSKPLAFRAWQDLLRGLDDTEKNRLLADMILKLQQWQDDPEMRANGWKYQPHAERFLKRRLWEE